MFRLICALALLWAMAPARADDTGAALAAARTIFLQGVDGDKHAVREATRRFRTLSVDHPGDPVFLAYFGASVTLQGRDAANGIDKERLTEDGLAKVDRALELVAAQKHEDPLGYLDTLLVAADTFIHIPAFFNRHERGKQLLSEILRHRAFDKSPPAFQAAAYLAAALVAHGEGDQNDYRRYLDLTLKEDPQGRDGRLALKLRDAQ